MYAPTTLIETAPPIDQVIHSYTSYFLAFTDSVPAIADSPYKPYNALEARHKLDLQIPGIQFPEPRYRDFDGDVPPSTASVRPTDTECTTYPVIYPLDDKNHVYVLGEAWSS